MIKAICLLLSTTLKTPKKAPQKMAQIEQKVYTKLRGLADNFLGQCFGENLVIFCKLLTLIHVTNGASHPYHLDDSIFNYRGIKLHISFYYLLRCKSNEGDDVFVASHLVLFSVFFFLCTVNRHARLIWAK